MSDEMYSREWWKERLPFIVPFSEGANILFEGRPCGDPAFDGYVEKYSRAPKTITVNGFEVPAPEKVALKIGTEYFIPFTGYETLAESCHWDNHLWDNLRLARGTIYLNKDHAIARAKAMLGIDPEEECK